MQSSRLCWNCVVRRVAGDGCGFHCDSVCVMRSTRGKPSFHIAAHTHSCWFNSQTNEEQRRQSNCCLAGKVIKRWEQWFQVLTSSSMFIHWTGSSISDGILYFYGRQIACIINNTITHLSKTSPLSRATQTLTVEQTKRNMSGMLQHKYKCGLLSSKNMPKPNFTSSDFTERNLFSAFSFLLFILTLHKIWKTIHFIVCLFFNIFYFSFVLALSAWIFCWRVF